MHTSRIPNLHLWCATQIDARIGFFAMMQFPVDQHFKVTVLTNGAKIVAFPRKNKHSIFHNPTFLGLCIGLHLRRSQFLTGHLKSFNRIGHQALPARQILSIKQTNEAGFHLVLSHLFVDELPKRSGLRTRQQRTGLLHSGFCSLVQEVRTAQHQL